MAESLRSDSSKASLSATKPSDIIPEDDDLLNVEILKSKEKSAKGEEKTAGAALKMEENVAPAGGEDLDSGEGFATYTGAPEKSSLRFVPAMIIGGIGLLAAGAAIFVLTKSDPGPKADPGAATTAAVTESTPEVDSVGALIRVADAKFVSGQVGGEGGALEILLKARAENPEDERVTIRLKPLADKYQDLGEAALKTGRLEEAATNFQIALDADPSRSELAMRLEEIKSQL
jgi:tetratricopeptide (TPR) repeat protein